MTANRTMTIADAVGVIKGAIQSISQSLQKELPGLRGYSAQNIRNMRSFYEEWALLTNCSPLASELQLLENKIESGQEIGERALLTINRSPLASDLQNIEPTEVARV